MTLHYIHFMVIVLASSVVAALLFNRLFGRKAQWVGLSEFRAKPE